MKVYKFGGASIETSERAKQVANIIQENGNEQLIVVISAMGKTTNALEYIVKAYFENDKGKALKLLHELKENHFAFANELLGEISENLSSKLQELITEIEFTLDEPLGRNFDYYYDQIVSIGELLSTSIVHAYLEKLKLSVTWVDIRDLLKTDSNYRDANIDWNVSEQLVANRFGEILKEKQIIITQGFIGSTDENNSVTLGREGSDYTAAILANMNNASSLSIWKDVPSLLNGDPKIFPDTVAIPEITFHEVIEMAYYGAQVIHPKTIKPLQNKHIPLYVKCFLDSSLPGTLIHESDKPIQYPPILVLKTKQTLLQVNTRDYSFITEDNLSRIYNIFHDCKIKINMIQNAAISFLACVDTNSEKLEFLLKKLKEDYDVKRNEDLFLFTVRHYSQEVLENELKNRKVLLTQKTRQTIQLVVQ